MGRLEALRSYRHDLVAIGHQCATGQRSLVRAAVALDRSGEWALDHAPTCAHWIAKALDIEVCTAREWLRVGHALSKLDLIDKAFEDGRLSYAKVRTLTRVATPDNQAELYELARKVPAGRLGVALAAWLAKHENPKDRDRRQHHARSLSWHTDPDGMIVGSFRFAPAAGGTLTATVDSEVRRATHRGRHASADAFAPPNETNRWPSLTQQRADALLAVVSAGGTGVLTEIVLHVRGDGCTLDDGTPIPDTVIERIAPRAFLRVLVHDANRRPINASGRHRHPSVRQQRLVKERDRVCVDCGSTDLLQYDHDPDYEATHRTVVDELRLRCAVCHHARHLGQAG